MDPNQIINGQNGEGEWLDDEKIPGVADSGAKKTFAHVVRYADGRVVTTYYRYGTNQQVGAPIVDIDKDQQKKWDEAKKEADRKAAAAQKPPEERPNYTTGFYEKYDPATQTWVATDRPVAAGEKPTTATTGEAKPPTEKDENGRHWVWQPNPGGPNAGGTWVDVGPAATKPATPPQERVNPADPTKRQQWDPTANGGAGAWVESGIVAEKPDKPQIVTMGDGTKKQAVIRDGKIVFEPIEGGEVKPPDTSGLPTLKLEVGRIAEELAAFEQVLDRDVKAGKLTPDQAKQVMEAKHRQATLKVNEINSIVNAQESQRNSDVTQRGQDATLVGQRLSSATTGFTNTLSQVAEMNRYAMPGSDAGGRALKGLLALQGVHQQMLGAGPSANPPRVQPGPAIQALQGITITTPQGTTVTLPSGSDGGAGSVGAQPAGAGGGPVSPSANAYGMVNGQVPQQPQYTSGAGADEPPAGGSTLPALGGIQSSLANGSAPNPFEQTNMRLSVLGFPMDVLNEATTKFLQGTEAA